MEESAAEFPDIIIYLSETFNKLNLKSISGQSDISAVVLIIHFLHDFPPESGNTAFHKVRPPDEELVIISRRYARCELRVSNVWSSEGVSCG